MASPFHIFRKHQRAMLAVVGILCMIGFSISGVGLLDNMSDRSGRAEDPVVATAYDQTLHESEVGRLIRQRGLVIRFLGSAIRTAATQLQASDFSRLAAGGDLQRFINPEGYLEGFVFGPPSEQSVLEAWVLGERARRMGMVVSDEAINEYLKQMTLDKVRPEELRAIVKEQQSSQPEVFEALRHELLAYRLREVSLRNVEATPAQRWEYYRRMNQQAVAEVAPLPVESFVDQVSDPSDEELAAFYDANKDREPRPDSPLPGFKVPKKAAFEVVIARYEEFNDPDAITDDEVNEFYEKHKDQRFLYSQHAFMDWDEEPASDADQAADEESSGENKTDETGANNKDAGNSVDSDKSGTKQTEKQDNDGGKKDGGASLRLPAHPAAALVGLLSADDDAVSDEAGAAKDDRPSTDKPSTDKATAAEPDKTRTAGDASHDDDTPAGKASAQPPPSKKSPSKKPKSRIPAIAPPITDELTLPRDIRKGENPKYAPLWKVERTIRKELARTKANEKIEKALQAVQGKMRQFSQRRLGSSGKSAKIDLEKLAAEHELSELKTGLLTAFELQEKFPELAAARGEGSGINFLSIAYSTLAVYQSTIVQDTEANRYLFWKTEDEPAYVPEFADARSKVLHIWKLVQARDLAEKKARELAAEAKKAGKPLKELFTEQGMTVTQTQPFSWMSRGTASADARGPLEVSEVEGVERPGADFMRETFSLGVGDVGQAMNQPKTVAYVIRVTSLQPPRELLRSAFMASPYMLYAEAGAEHRQQIIESWRKGIEAEAHLTWVKTENENPGGP